MPIPGGYVVPERGNITFNCSSSTGGILLWTVDLGIPERNQKDTPSTGLKLPQVRTMDTQPFANPASITIHNVTSENNQSFVECSKIGSGMSNATLIVEGKGSFTMSNRIQGIQVQYPTSAVHLGLAGPCSCVCHVVSQLQVLRISDLTDYIHRFCIHHVNHSRTQFKKWSVMSVNAL